MEHSSSDITIKDNIHQTMESDTEISDSKIIFDVNQFHITDIPTTNRKQTEYVPIKKYSSHSEELLSPQSESYECFYLFDDNKEQSIIDEKKNSQINYIIINDYFQIKSKPIINNESLSYSLRSHDTNHPLDSLDDDEEHDSFSLFNEHDSSSDTDTENEMITPIYKINIPSIQIPKTQKELIQPIRPAFKLHLEMIDNDGKIKRDIINHENYKKHCKHKNIYKNKNKKCDQNINHNKNIFKDVKYKHKSKQKQKQPFSFRTKILNVLNYYIFENNHDLNMKSDYF